MVDSRASFLSKDLFTPVLLLLWVFSNILSQNYNEITSVYLIDFIIALAVILVIIFSLSILLKKTLANAYLASFITLVLSIVLLFSGALFERAQHGLNLVLFTFSTRNPIKFLTIELILIALIILLLVKNRRFLKVANHWITILIAIMLIMSIPSLIMQFQTQPSNKPSQPVTRLQPTVQPTTDSTPKLSPIQNATNYPNIYYIILDGYANHQVLEKHFDFDNSPFLNTLKQKGFYIAENSISNYAQTGLSLPSSLNFNYLNELASLSKSERSEQIHALFQQNKIMTIAKDHGYKTINFSTSWGLTAAISAANTNIKCGSLNEFYFLMLRQSLLGLFIEKLNTSRRDYILCPFERLPSLAKMPSPTLFFVHIISPHTPYLFDRDGNEIEDARNLNIHELVNEDPTMYLDQLIFINKKVITLVDSILSNSETEPIIVIQSDHGSSSLFKSEDNWNEPTTPMLNERMRILNLYHVPPSIESQLYSGISPVNSFRVIYNDLFNLNLPLLPDKSYYSSYFSGEASATYHDVTEKVSGPLKAEKIAD